MGPVAQMDIEKWIEFLLESVLDFVVTVELNFIRKVKIFEILDEHWKVNWTSFGKVKVFKILCSLVMEFQLAVCQTLWNIQNFPPLQPMYKYITEQYWYWMRNNFERVENTIVYLHMMASFTYTQEVKL